MTLPARLTLPSLRALMQDVLTAHVSPAISEWMLERKDAVWLERSDKVLRVYAARELYVRQLGEPAYDRRPVADRRTELRRLMLSFLGAIRLHALHVFTTSRWATRAHDDVATRPRDMTR
jgi:hypothetical protein